MRRWKVEEKGFSEKEKQRSNLFLVYQEISFSFVLRKYNKNLLLDETVKGLGGFAFTFYASYFAEQSKSSLLPK